MRKLSTVKWNTVSDDGQLSIDNMDVVPIKIGGGQETLEDKIQKSYKALQLASEMSHAYYGKPVVITYSGGKDSDVILRLAEECLGTDFEVINSHTTVDLPPTVYHIQDVFKRLAEKGIKAGYTNRFPVKKTMWELIVERQTMPTRVLRMCCRVLKETGTKNRIAILGVRAAESSGRQGREIFGVRGGYKADWKFFSLDHASEVFKESQEIQDDAWDCTLIKSAKENKDLTVNVIYEWTDEDVWDFIKDRGIEVNPLYAQGFRRVGCALCPLSTPEEKMRVIRLYPTYKQAYINAAQKMLESDAFKKKKNVRWKTGEEVYNWWIELDKKNIEGQMSFDDLT